MLFDLDGTLLDTLADIGESMNEVLAARGHPRHPLVAYRGFIGEGVALLAERALPPGFRDERTVAECVEDMRVIYGGRWDCQTRPYDGITDLLARLETSGLALAVLSNKPHELTRLVTERLLADTRFTCVVGARNGVPRKPDPTAALAIARKLDIAPDAIAYVGDTATDMHTAGAAGMYAIGAVWGFRDAEELAAAGARTLARRPGDVAAAVL
ncbi:MAG: HAD family hydrolase [Candidatus Binatia bacterium]